MSLKKSGNEICSVENNWKDTIFSSGNLIFCDYDFIFHNLLFVSIDNSTLAAGKLPTAESDKKTSLDKPVHLKPHLMLLVRILYSPGILL